MDIEELNKSIRQLELELASSQHTERDSIDFSTPRLQQGLDSSIDNKCRESGYATVGGSVLRTQSSGERFTKDNETESEEKTELGRSVGARRKSVSIGATPMYKPGRVAQSVGHLTRKSGVLGSIPGLATYFRFSFRFFKKGSCQLLAKVCARSTG